MKTATKKVADSLQPPSFKRQLLCYGGAALFFVLFLLAVVLLNRPLPGAVATSASLRTFVPARVTAVRSDNAAPDSWTEGLRIGTQGVELKLLSGEYRGKILPADNYLNAYANVDVKEGTRVIVRLDLDEGGSPYVVAIVNYDRGPVLGVMALLFALMLVVIGGKKGVKALLGLAFTLVALWFLLIPLISRGFSPILSTVFLVVLTTAVSLLLLNGLSQKTLCATLGCVGGVTVAGLVAALVGVLTPLGGFNMPEAEELVLRAGEQGVHIRGLLVCGVLIAALGAVMDVAMAISSSLWELRTLNPKLDTIALFRSGMNIGRDAMGTMANTLILAFVGSSLNMLLLFRIFDYPYLQILNSDLMAVEIIQGLAGSMGIVLTVPLVALISARIMTLPKKKNQSAGHQ
ncbi:MAG: YibE/F family protein [Oscillospiraceae bacterium]